MWGKAEPRLQCPVSGPTAPLSPSLQDYNADFIHRVGAAQRDYN